MFIKVLIVILAIWIGYTFFYDPFQPDKLKGKRIMVTGASQGIGEQMVYHYCRCGSSVIVTARNATKLKKVVRKCEELGGKAYYVTGDMLDTGTPKHLHMFAVDTLGGLDQLVLNHMMLFDLALWQSEANMTFLRNTYQVNFHSFVELASRFIPQLNQSSGGITVVNSVVGLLPAVLSTSYASSKHALDGFFKSLDLEFYLRDMDIRITIAYLGIIGTDDARKRLKSFTSITEGGAMEDVSLTAEAIVKASSLRKRQMFFPRYIAVLSLIKEWVPRAAYEFLARSACVTSMFSQSKVC